jgi:hypothetical protein
VGQSRVFARRPRGRWFCGGWRRTRAGGLTADPGGGCGTFATRRTLAAAMLFSCALRPVSRLVLVSGWDEEARSVSRGGGREGGKKPPSKVFLRAAGRISSGRVLTHHHDGALHALHLGRTFTRELRDSPGLDSSSAVWRRQSIWRRDAVIWRQSLNSLRSAGLLEARWQRQRRVKRATIILFVVSQARRAGGGDGPEVRPVVLPARRG